MRSPAPVLPLIFLLAGWSAPFPAGLQARLTGDGAVVGSLVSVSVEVDGAPVSLYAAPDGSDRYYLEARQGSQYAVSVMNRTSERLGILLVVDGLNAITGRRQAIDGRWTSSATGSLYVLEPWDGVTVRGWRTSLDDVRRFTFVDERASYAARSGKANGRMGWIEVLVYRDRERVVVAGAEHGRISDGRDGAAEAPSSRGAMARPQAAPPSRDADKESAQEPGYGASSFPGTGWGSRASDPAVLVHFEPERRTAERITLRYEYLDTLIALGVLPRPWYASSRLEERERGGEGFAQPPPR
jgi:hypothetical protein